MGILADIGMGAGLVAAPFTGGASMIPLLMGAGGAIGGLGDALTGGNTSGAATAMGNAATVAGSAEAAREKALVDQARIQQTQDQLNQNRALLALRAPSLEAANAAHGDVLANAQDAAISGLPSYLHVPNISGGLRPSMLSANSRQLGANMSRNALLNNMSGADVPALTALPQAGPLDTALQATSLIGGFGNALLGGVKPGTTSTTAGASTPGGTTAGATGSDPTATGSTGYTLPPTNFGYGASTSGTLPPIDFSAPTQSYLYPNTASTDWLNIPQ